VVTTPQATVSSAPNVEAAAGPAAQWWVAKSGKASVIAPSDAETRNRATAEAFFAAFGRRDLGALEQLYRPDATFKDDMFTLSKRSSIMTMWKGAPPFASFKAEVLEAKGDQVKAKWVVEYEMFGNTVRNEIESTLTFDVEGKVSSQHETWDKKKWMSQALPIVPKFLQGVVYAVLGPILSARMGG
jgi:hypothetical protein